MRAMIMSILHRAFYRFFRPVSRFDGPLLWRRLLPDPAVLNAAQDSLWQRYITGTLNIAIHWPFSSYFIFSDLRILDCFSFLHSGIQNVPEILKTVDAHQCWHWGQ